MASQPSPPSISVVVPVHNGGPTFRSCIESIQHGLGEKDELIVVADGTSDGAWRAAQDVSATLLHNDQPRGPAHARNKGARAATGDILFFVDADVTLGPTTLDQVRAAFTQDADLHALIGSYDDAPAHPGFLSQYRNLLHHFTHQTASGRTSTFWGACGAVRRPVFESVDGFDERYTVPCVEDIELGYRLTRAGSRIEVHEHIQVKHHKCWTAAGMIWTDVFRRGAMWTILIFRYRQLDNNLNVDVASRLSVLLALTLLASVGMATVYLPALLLGIGATGGLATLNRSFYRFLYQKRGFVFTLRALPWHWLYFAYSGFAFAYGSLWYLLQSRLNSKSLPRQPKLA